jgi:hypothetical protein
MIEGSCQCGAVQWRFEGIPESATACNCSICRRYGALWAYDYENEKIKVSGATQVYMWNRKWIEFHFCSACGCVAYWRAAMTPADGRRRIAVNMRLAAPDAVAAVKAIALVHHDTDLRDDLPADGMHVADVWS